MTQPFAAPSLAHLSFQQVSGREPVAFTNAERLVAFRDAMLRIKAPDFSNTTFVFKREPK